YHKFHVTLILEDVAVTTAPAWDVGVVVVFGEMQFEHRAFGATVLNGIDRIQAVGRLFNSPVFVVVRIRIALPGRKFSIPCVNVGSADGEAWKIPVFQVIHRTEEDRFFAVGVEVRTVIPPDIQATVLTSTRSEEHTSELQSRFDLVCRLLLEKKKAQGCGSNAECARS